MKMPMWLSWIVLIIGILYLIKDILAWDYWWSLSWWTVAFIIVGLTGIIKTK